MGCVDSVTRDVSSVEQIIVRIQTDCVARCVPVEVNVHDVIVCDGPIHTGPQNAPSVNENIDPRFFISKRKSNIERARINTMSITWEMLPRAADRGETRGVMWSRRSDD